MKRNYLEQLQFKKQPQNAPLIELDLNKSTTIQVKQVLAEEPEKGVKKPALNAMGLLERYKKKAIVNKQISTQPVVEISDLRGNVNLDYDMILKRLHENKIIAVTGKSAIDKPPIVFSETIVSIPKAPIKKTSTHVVIQPMGEIDGDESEKEDSDGEQSDYDEIPIPKRKTTLVTPEPQEPISNRESQSDVENEHVSDIGTELIDNKKIPNVDESEILSDNESETIDINNIPKKTPAKRGRKKKTETAITEVPNAPTKTIRVTKKAKQLSITTPAIKLTKAEIARRLPKQEKLVVKTSQYYLNNRKLFIQKIKDLFKPYEKELAEMGEIASCAKDHDKEFSLLTHQKIVRDYLNLFTPYRGLLLYHGLGSGKTCTSIGIAEGMKSSKQIILMTPASLKTNFFTELKMRRFSLQKESILGVCWNRWKTR